jgi:ribosomal protein S18 acetylase RimI-like enzyme
MRIVAAGAAELADGRALVFEYFAATQGERGRPVPASPDELPELLRADLDDLPARYAEPGALFVAYGGDQAYGCVGLRPHSEPGPTEAVAEAEVSRLYVRSAYRGAGVARALMTTLLDHARIAGFTRVVLGVMTTRVAVIAFYRRLGFVETGAEIAYGTPMVLMSRPL